MGRTSGTLGGMLALFLMVTDAPAFDVAGLATPESFIVDPETGEYYISNINGPPTEKDNNGFISKLDPSGKVVALKFVEGGRGGATLHAPKGLDVIGDVLYASDIDAVRGFDKKTGKPLHTIDLSGMSALFLNDLTHDEQGILYVSDTTIFVNPRMAGAIFKIDTRNRHKASVFVRSPELFGPNGLVVHSRTQRLLADTWDAGRIVEIEPDGRIHTVVEHGPWKNLDGLDYDLAGNLYVSSFTGGKIYKVATDLTVSVLRSGLNAPADINVDRKGNRILVPSFNGNSATTISIGP